MATISFYCQGQTLNIESNLSYPSSPVLSSNQIIERTGSGKPIVEDVGSYDMYKIELSFSKLKNQDYDNLVEFVRVISVWAKYPVIYTDPDGVEWNTIITSGELNFPRRGPYYRSGSLKLETIS